MTDSQQLLAEYARTGSESAFRELVERYVDLVYATALRLVGGNAHMAEDVVQSVFIGFAKKGRTLSSNVMPGSWLYQSTYHLATKAVRAERRRQVRETEAVHMNALQGDSEAALQQLRPVLDEAITTLGAEDRTAIVLRFFEQRDFRSIGTALGSNEDAARMRVSRALGKLQSILSQRGFTLTAAALGATLATQAVAAAPAGLAASISTTALASAAATSGLTLITLKFMTMTKIQIAAGAIVIASLGTALVAEHRSLQKLRDENNTLREQAEQVALLQEENQRLASLSPRAGGAQSSQEQLTELLRLRNEIGNLRRQTNELAKLRADNEWLRASVAGAATPPPAPDHSAASPDEVLKESWAFVGYADPDSAFQSAIWAGSQGDGRTFLASLDPAGNEAKRWVNKSEEEAAKWAQNEFRKLTGFKILDREIVSEEEVILTIQALGVGANEQARFLMKRDGDQWKLSGQAKKKPRDPAAPKQ